MLTLVGADRGGDALLELDLARLAESALREAREHTRLLEQSCRELADLLDDIGRPAEEDELVPASALAARRELLLRQARTEVLVVLTSDTEPGADRMRVEREQLSVVLEQGVCVRVLLAGGWAVSGAPSVTAFAPGPEAWSGSVEVRAVEVPVTSMTVVDHTAALLGGPDTAGGTVVGQPPVITALHGLFEARWELAAVVLAPAHADQSSEPSVPDDEAWAQHARLARLLADGATDEAVARTLGISVRRLVRLVAAMRTDLDVQSRFQLGVEAARRGIV